MIWAAVHITLAPTQIRVAAGPAGSADVLFVQMLTQKFAARTRQGPAACVPPTTKSQCSGDRQWRGRPRDPAEHTRQFARLAGGRHSAAECDGADRSHAAAARAGEEGGCPPAPQQASAPEKKEKAAKRRRAPTRPKPRRTTTAAITPSPKKTPSLKKTLKSPPRLLTRLLTRARTRTPTTATRPTAKTRKPEPVPTPPTPTSSTASPSLPASTSASSPATRRRGSSWTSCSAITAFRSTRCRSR